MPTSRKRKQQPYKSMTALEFSEALNFQYARGQAEMIIKFRASLRKAKRDEMPIDYDVVYQISSAFLKHLMTHFERFEKPLHESITEIVHRLVDSGLVPAREPGGPPIPV
jgi:hypothetical protein